MCLNLIQCQYGDHSSAHQTDHLNEHFRFGTVIELLFFVFVIVESTEQSDQLKQSLKEEKQTRKRLESKVDHIEEELNDLRNEKESLERVRVLSGTRHNCYGGMCQYTFRAGFIQLS